MGKNCARHQKKCSRTEEVDTTNFSMETNIFSIMLCIVDKIIFSIMLCIVDKIYSIIQLICILHLDCLRLYYFRC